MKTRASFTVGCRSNNPTFQSWTLFFGPPPPEEERGHFLAGVVHPTQIQNTIRYSIEFIYLVLEIEGRRR